MTEQPLAIPLTPPERDLIRGLRAIPDSELKRRILDAVDDLIRIGQEPRCTDAQADGVPCGCSRSDCETCNSVFQRVTGLVDQNFPSRTVAPRAPRDLRLTA